MKRTGKIALAFGGVLLGAGALTAVALASRTASAKEDDKPSKSRPNTQRKVRHGLEYDGCNVLRLVDPEAAEAHLRDNSLKLITWLPRVADIRKNPEPLLVDVLEIFFPECSWPPSQTWVFEGPDDDVWDWDELVQRVGDHAADSSGDEMLALFQSWASK